MGPDDKPDLKFNLDIKLLQRAVLPYIILKVLSETDEALSGIEIREKVCELMSLMFSRRDIQESLPKAALEATEFEINVSVLYPMLHYMVGEGWIGPQKGYPYKIKSPGRKKLEGWKALLNQFNDKME